MATTHNHEWHELPRKRSWQEEDGAMGFHEHRNKRLQSLPFRTSPTQKRWSDPPSFPCTITPTESDCEEKSASMTVDGDADMMVDDSNVFLGSCQHGALNANASGRMPTPINASFAAQVRGNNWQPPNPDSVMVSGHQPFPMASEQDPSIPRTLAPSPEWSMVQNRRLPSPISESGGEEMMPVSPGMVLDSTEQRPHLPHMPHSTNPAAQGLLHPNIQTNSQLLPSHPESDDSGMMDREGSPCSAPASPSPGRKIGHCRSKHTLNSWTLQPGMKKSFSIGYRADCDKCQQKIPGHFNHIIVS